jgi:enterochelin esterase-like enzyme
MGRIHRRFVLILLIFVLSTGCAVSLANANEFPNETEKKGTLVLSEIPAPSLQNNLIGEPLTQGISVYLPSSYDTSSQSYPVIYFLPGFDDSYVDYGNIFKAAMDSLLSSNKIREMIVVSVNGRNKLHGSFYVNSPVTGNWEDFVVKDVVNYVDNHFRTIKDRQSRGLAGHSMGGSGTISIAMHQPELFSCIYSMSPGLFNEKGIKRAPFNMFAQKDDKLATMSKKQARAEYLKKIGTLQWPDDCTYAYGAAFSFDVGKAPYIKFLHSSADAPKLEQDEVWQAWNNGFGNVKAKIIKYKENHLRLKAITTDYGINDDSTWIPDGCVYFSQQLSKENINHKLLTYDGHHQDKVGLRIQESVLPFFSENLSK